MTPQLARARRQRLASFTHFLDPPILLTIVSLGVLRPGNRTRFAIGMAVAVAVAAALNHIVPRLYPWGGEENGHLGDDRPALDAESRSS